MARSDRPRQRSRLAFGVVLALFVPAVVACNSIIGLTDFSKGECAGGKCGDGGELPDQLVDGGPDAPVDAPPDVRGTAAVSWAKWPMPNYGEAGAGPPNTPKLNVVADTVVDGVTQLTWRSTVLPVTVSAAQADVECKKLTGTWRAPSRIELVTLLDYAQAPSPFFVDSTKFTDVKNSVIWTTSPVRPVTAKPADQSYWVVDFGSGVVKPLLGISDARVLCVAAK